MKNFAFLLCVTVLALSLPVDSLHAQTSKKEIKELLKSLKNEKEIDVSITFSQAIIHGKREADFVYLEDIGSREDWTTLWENEYKPGLFHDLLGVFNTYMFDSGYRVKFGNFEQSKYQIKLKITGIAEKGTVYMNALLKERGQEEPLYELTVAGGGGTFGSKINLMGDGFRRAGLDLAKQMILIFKRGRVGMIY